VRVHAGLIIIFADAGGKARSSQQCYQQGWRAW
jgi:hypothetical protein